METTQTAIMQDLANDGETTSVEMGFRKHGENVYSTKNNTIYVGGKRVLNDPRGNMRSCFEMVIICRNMRFFDIAVAERKAFHNVWIM